MSRWISLKTRIPVVTLCLLLTGIWAVSLMSIQLLQQDTEALLRAQQASAASLLAQQIDNEIVTRLKALEATSQSIAPIFEPENQAQLQTFIEQNKALLTLFSGGIMLFDEQGTVVAEAPSSLERTELNYADFPAIKEAITSGLATVAPPTMGKKIKAPLLFMATPLMDAQGTIHGALAGAVNLTRTNFLEQISTPHDAKTGNLLLIDKNTRSIVMASDKQRIMAKLPAHIDFSQPETLGRIALGSANTALAISSTHTIPSTGWIMISALPAAEALSPVNALRLRILTATAMLSTLIAILLWWALRKQLSPLTIAAKALSTMGAHPRALTVKRRDEIGQLIEAFNQLIQTLTRREALLQRILDTSNVAIFTVSNDGIITQANPKMAEMFGRPITQIVGSEYVSLIHPAEREAGRAKMLALLQSKIPLITTDRLYWRGDGTEFWGNLSGQRLHHEDTPEVMLVGVIADVDKRKRGEEKLQLAASVFTHAREGIVITTPDGSIMDVNDAFSRITGYSRAEVLGKNPRILKSGHHDDAFYREMWTQLKDHGEWSGEIWNRRKNGELYAEMRTISAVKDEYGVTRQYVSLFSDITPLKEHEKQLENMAHYDVLTTLPNRALLADRLHQAMAQTQRHRQQLAVVYLDLDGFKTVNDTLGHEAGDQLLVALSQRMKQTLREGDTLARLGGDEFVAVLMDLNDTAICAPLLDRLLSAAREELIVDNERLQVSASLGVTFFPQNDTVDADQLLRQADQAMYQAKLAGKNRYKFFDADQDRTVRGHHESLLRIEQALHDDEFVLYFQPKVNMRSGAIVGAEALIRWQHPEKGVLPPSVFLPVIENHAMAVQVGEWVIDAALSEIERWMAAGLCIPVSVNIGAKQLQRVDFSQRLRALLAKHADVPPSLLAMEVLETSALEDLLHASQVIRECRDLGITFALDDFGTGYSSLTYLKRLPVSQLKIDQSFVRDMLDDPDDLTILEGVISLAAAFEREVIAEGVESIAHGEMLLQLGCELAQGYGIAIPMPGDMFLSWANAWRPDPSWQQALPVKRDNLPLLFSGVEHRAWVANLISTLKDERMPLPPLDEHECRFGHWLDGEGYRQHGKRSQFIEICKKHEQVHALARSLCQHRHSDANADLTHGIEALYEYSDEMLALLRELMLSHH